jgi:Domain of unknown function (DU1801)
LTLPQALSQTVQFAENLAMQSKEATVEAYVASLPEDRQVAVNAIRKAINGALPTGFAEVMNYGMIGWVVPHALYPAGYHCDTKLPLPFMGLASQKNSVNLYHMALYADAAMLAWFKAEHAMASARKLDMGKSCIRYKKLEDVPLKLLAQLAGKMTVKQWVAVYEKEIKR